MRKGLHTSSVNVAHPSCELFSQIMTRKVDVEKRRLGIAVPSELGNLVNLPAGTGQVC